MGGSERPWVEPRRALGEGIALFLGISISSSSSSLITGVPVPELFVCLFDARAGAGLLDRGGDLDGDLEGDDSLLLLLVRLCGKDIST